MKVDFFDELDNIMKNNEKVFLICVGLGYPRLDLFLKRYPYRTYNTEASEQTALDMAVGIAYAGYIPVVYTITPFLFRAFETIRTYVNHEKLHVVMIGAGRNDDYSQHDGFSHYAGDDKILERSFSNIICRWPENKEQLKHELHMAIEDKAPTYINIKR